MRKVLLICILCLSQHSLSQVVSSFGAYEAQGNKVSDLDARYKSALHTNLDLAVFKTEDEQRSFTEAYQNMLAEFGSFLAKSDFSWEQQTRGFNRIYFNENGTVDYFLFDFKNLDAKKAATFQQLLSEFLKTYNFPIKPKIKFAQCSPVVYK
ncbi:hypothetical protein [Flavobacterium aurantiibacter]|uniref:hypothetical protein n=1 Tax=Flavobacterium aurantiibacter TaxID=2023067 RepID=UPI0010565681|nr:hypothetical protein [Flavobacterium aurantiibacter]